MHEILEHFFSLDTAAFDEQEYAFGLRSYVTAQLLKLWKQNQKRLSSLGLTAQELEHYLIDSQDQLHRFVERFCKRIADKMSQGLSFAEAFKHLTPRVEEEIKNTEFSVRGFIDAIHESDDKIVIMDYKTSKKDELTEAYRLQLAIYALLYYEKHHKLPDKVGIDFLKFGEQTLEVDEAMVEYAKREIRFIHEHTESAEINDYERTITPLCKWNGGQCDFYDVCKPHG